MNSFLRHRRSLLYFRRWKSSSREDNPVSVVFGEETAILSAQKGIPADNKPFKLGVEKYTEYTWCGCGLGHEQPFCDLTCKSKYWKKIYRDQGGPLTYIAPETKDVWFCNCKQTDNPPFCDGTHRRADIQEMRIDGKHELFEPNRLKQRKNKDTK